LGVFACGAFWLFACGDGLCLIFFAFAALFCMPAALGLACSFAFAALVRLVAYGVGLSLICYRSVSVAPVRGGTYFLCRRKER
jgi:hypothetical protein